MKFFLDENFPRPALIQLQSAGHTAVHALEIFTPGTPDDQLFAHAQRESAVFITTDKDFSTPSRWPLPGITARLSLPCAGRIATNCCADWPARWSRLAKEKWMIPYGLSLTPASIAARNRKPMVKKLECFVKFRPRATLREIVRLTAK
jgi:hypothetical protein